MRSDKEKKLGKTQGKWPKTVPVWGKHMGFGNFDKTHGILFAHVVNALIPKIQHIAIFTTTFSNQVSFS